MNKTTNNNYKTLKSLLNNRKEMLETIHMTYLYALDAAFSNVPKKLRLSKKQQIELGKRLSIYWDIKK
jgi:hypothetical protein